MPSVKVNSTKVKSVVGWFALHSKSPLCVLEDHLSFDWQVSYSASPLLLIVSLSAELFDQTLCIDLTRTYVVSLAQGTQRGASQRPTTKFDADFLNFLTSDCGDCRSEEKISSALPEISAVGFGCVR